MTAPISQDLFPIRTVSSMTGVNAITLRAWERRHGLVRPQRTENGRRLYAQADIDTIHRIVALLGKGISIGQVKDSLSAPASARNAQRSQDRWAPVRQEMIEAIAQFDEDRLEDAYDSVQARYRDELVIKHVLSPLLAELGERWVSAVGSVGEEHFFSVYLRNKLGARFHHRTRLSGARRVLAACLPGEMHEAGLLLFCLALHERGIRPVLLGADMPMQELPQAARRARCEAVVLSGSICADAAHFEAPLARMVEESSVPVLVGGRCTLPHHDAIRRAGAVSLGVDIAQGAQLVLDQLDLH